MILSDLIKELETIDSEAIVDGFSHHYIETVNSIDQNWVAINGNRQGLIYLALSCLRLAEKGLHGSHQHFDEAGMVDKSEVDVVVGYVSPPCESEVEA